MADLWKCSENWRSLLDFLNGASSSVRIIGSDVLENICEPAPGFIGSRYCCHERMRCSVSSFEIVRFASASASPRPTIT